jgi:hypothetical protein
MAGIDQGLQRYRLYKQFSMPTNHGSVAAVSVTTEIGQRILSFYTLMLQTIILELWIIVVLFLMYFTSGKGRNVTHNVAVANVAIWNSKWSPFSIFWSMLGYLSIIPKHSAMWVILAFIAFSGQILFSTFVSPHLIIGQAAPVNPQVVFVPLESLRTLDDILRYFLVTAPADFRAIGSLDSLDPFTGNENVLNSTNSAVHFNSGTIGIFNETLPVYQFNYSYSVTGVDFGLQHAPKLSQLVQGSCYTEYNWFNQTVNTSGTESDYYNIPCAKGTLGCTGNSSLFSVSAYDSRQPSVSVHNISPTDPLNSTYSTNYTFAFVISSLNRLSVTESNDPWYLTEPYTSSTNLTENRVLPGRPVLFCWQADTWSYKGQNRSSINLDELGVLSPGILNITRQFLSGPRIISLADNLGVSALVQATSASLDYFFDASTSSMKNDLQRLVYASYVATKNTFAETTVSNHAQYPSIQNGLISPTNGSLMDGTGDFVVYGAGFTALSLGFLIAVPIAVALLSSVVWFLGSNKWVHWSWGNLNAMDATILYSAIDSKNFRGDDEVTWKRLSSSPYHRKNETALVRPEYNRHDRSYGWASASDQ